MGVYEKTSGLYYDYKTGFYFDAERSLFYDGSRGVYYTYNYDTAEYEVYVDNNKASVIRDKGSKKARSAKKYDNRNKIKPDNQDKSCHEHYKLSRKEGRKRASSVDSAVPTNPTNYDA